MGLYLNPGNDAFYMAVNDDIYVDKSEMISWVNRKLNKNSRYICVSRPRRFGKSMTAEMLASYYSRGCDSSELFEKLKTADSPSFKRHLNKYDVIHLNIQQFLRKTDSLCNLSKRIERDVIAELHECYPDYISPEQQSLPDVLSTIYFKKTGNEKGFIFIIDEWDCLFRIARSDTVSQKNYLDFLRDLFKDRTYVTLAYMTGILPIKKYGTHSALNIFDEYSMVNPGELAPYTGFTEEEVKTLCEQFQMNFHEVKKWYDGYHFSECLHIYNPKSVVDVMLKKEFGSYWTETETYEALKIYIEMDYDGLKDAIIIMLGNGTYPFNPRKFQNDMTTFKTKDDVLTLLVHLGYLAYDKEKQEAFIPNQEIAAEFLNAVDEPAWDCVIQAISRSKKLLDATFALDQAAVADEMNAIHTETTSLLKYNDENSLTCSVFIAYYSAKLYYLPPIREMPTGAGFADVVYLPRKNIDKPALLIELKWDKSATGAIEQIKKKQYTQWIENYTGEILLVGINYDKLSKHHECVIERMK